MSRDAIVSDNPALKSLPFSAGVRAGPLTFFSGQVGLDPESGKLAAGVDAQTRKAIDNAAAVLAAAGKTLDDVVKVNVFLTDMADYPVMNAAYAKAFAAPYPARTCVGVAGLPLGARVEIEVVAV